MEPEYDESEVPLMLFAVLIWPVFVAFSIPCILVWFACVTADRIGLTFKKKKT